MASQYEEKEMIRNQRALVDTCFEEGQFEAGMSTLDQLRSSGCRPSIDHIQQLLYLALYPLPQVVDEDNTADLRASPSKVQAAKNRIPVQLPTPPATAAAQRILMSFARTNRPISLLGAIPTASELAEEHIEADELFIAEQGKRIIGGSKGCWVLVKEGFVTRRRMPATKSRKVKRWQDELEDEDPNSYDEPLAVAPNAWPVLEWLIVLFEKDEEETEKQGLPRYSPILLSHIPEARGSVGGRWDANPPMTIIVHCLQSPTHARVRLGTRLLNLLVHLTSTNLVDFSLFISIINLRLTNSPDEDFVSTVLANMPLTIVALRFKIALCMGMLTTNDVSANATFSSSKPKPQGRPQPRARQQRGDQAAAAATPVEATPPPTIESIASKRGAPPWSTIAHALDANENQVALKFELLTAFTLLQREDERKDPEWQGVVEDGQLDALLNKTFGSNAMYAVALSALAKS